MVWNWEIFEENRINVVWSLASNSSLHFARRLSHEILAYWSRFRGMQIFAAPDALQRVRNAIGINTDCGATACGVSFRIFQLA
jgi:hypothetical protein